MIGREGDGAAGGIESPPLLGEGAGASDEGDEGRSANIRSNAKEKPSRANRIHASEVRLVFLLQIFSFDRVLLDGPI